MAEEPKAEKISLEELLMVSTLAMTDATVKLLIAKGVFTDDEIQSSAQHRTGELSCCAETLAVMAQSLAFSKVRYQPFMRLFCDVFRLPMGVVCFLRSLSAHPCT
jgi:hypothetical protein